MSIMKIRDHSITPIVPDETLNAWGNLYESEKLHDRIPFLIYIRDPRRWSVRFGVYEIPDYRHREDK